MNKNNLHIKPTANVNFITGMIVYGNIATSGRC